MDFGYDWGHGNGLRNLFLSLRTSLARFYVPGIVNSNILVMEP